MLQLETPKREYEHNFKRVWTFQNDVPALRKPKKGRAKFWCNQCDTLAEFTDKFSEWDVNMRMRDSKLPCAAQIDGLINPFAPKGLVS